LEIIAEEDENLKTMDDRKESFVESFDFDDDLEDLLDDQKVIPNTNFKDLKITSVQKSNPSPTINIPQRRSGTEKIIQSKVIYWF
jgi:hypothetical protein